MAKSINNVVLHELKKCFLCPILESIRKLFVFVLIFKVKIAFSLEKFLFILKVFFLLLEKTLFSLHSCKYSYT